jgi:glutamate-1-semialdehyde 2,1-aminomutase
LSGNPLATAAGLAALELLDDAAYDRITATAQRLGDGLAKAFVGAGRDVCVPVEATLVGLHFGPVPATEYVSARRTDERAYARAFHELLDRGVAIAPGAYEVLFPGLAHDDAVIDQIIAAAEQAAASIG